VVRGVRREYNDLFKASQKEGDVGEDELKRYLERIQDETDACCKLIDDVVKAKESEILEI
jgi:ribosome recycling factor